MRRINYKAALFVVAAVLIVGGVSAGIAKADSVGPTSGQITLSVQTATATDSGFPSDNSAEAYCPSGTVVVGGGYKTNDAGGSAVGESRPDAAGNGWVAVQTGGNSGAVMTVYAVCASL